MKAWIELDTGEEIEVDVEYEYQPVEPQTHNYPGCDESITLCQVQWYGDDIELNQDTLDILEQKAWEDVRA